MTRLDILQHLCDLTDNLTTDTVIKPKLLRFIDKAYVECLRREYKELPLTPLTDTTVLLIDDRNAPFLGFYSAWMYYLNEQDTAMAGIMKDEYEGFRIYKPSKEPIKVIDVYGIGDLSSSSDIVGVSQYE